MSLHTADAQGRKEYPIFSGFIQYFPAAMAAVAHHSYVSNQRHNPGLPLCHDRSKSGDDLDALSRHLAYGEYVEVAWRAMSWLQKVEEAKGAPIAPAAINVAALVLPTLREALEERASDEMPLNHGEAV